MRICVTGGMGYIGSELSLALHKAGHEVDVYDWKLRHPWKDLFYAKKFDYDIIYHLAAISGNVACDKYPISFVEKTNVKSCQHIIEHCREDTRIIYASTSAIYGERHGIYAETKLAGERIIKQHSNNVCLRLATIYGVSRSMRENILVNDFVKSATMDGYIVLRNKYDRRPYMNLNECIDILLWFIKFEFSQTFAFCGQTLDVFNYHSFESKDYIASIIHQLTDCDIFYSDKQDKYPQNFANIATEKGKWFEQKQFMTPDILTSLVNYYDR